MSALEPKSTTHCISLRSAPKVSKKEWNHVTTEVIKHVIIYIRVRARVSGLGSRIRNPQSFFVFYFWTGPEDSGHDQEGVTKTDEHTQAQQHQDPPSH